MKEMGIEYNNIINRLYKLNKKYTAVNISDVGCFELKLTDVYTVINKTGIPVELIDLYFKRLGEKKLLSRNAIYYNFEDFHANIDKFTMLLTQVVLLYEENESISYVLAALLEYFENYQLTYWYALWEFCVDNVEIQDILYEYLNKIKLELERFISISLKVYIGDDFDSKHVANDIMKQCALIKESWILAETKNKLSFRLFREFDNRIKCINEIVYIILAMDMEGTKIDNLFMPLYGASLLAVYALPVLHFFDLGKNINVCYARIGFHDLLPLKLSVNFVKTDEVKIAPDKYLRKLKKTLKNKTTLIIDDNVGYGITIKYCKKMVEFFWGKCLTRTVETSWDSILNANDKLIVDYPSISNYFRYTDQYQFIECLKKADTYTREIEYKKCKRFIESQEINKDIISWVQRERMKREFEIKKKFALVEFEIGDDAICCKNRINIDIYNGRCTADETLDVASLIEESLKRHMEICIVDLNKSINSVSTNEISQYLDNFPNRLWVAGGISSLNEARMLILRGAKGVVIGSALYNKDNVNIEFVNELINELGADRVCFSVDFLGENIVVKGFEETTKIKVDETLRILVEKCGNANVILIDVDASKNKKLVDFERIYNITKDFPDTRFFYGGNLADIDQVKHLNNENIGAILGKNYIRSIKTYL